MQTISVANRKGGVVGKTTVVANLGDEFARKGMVVLLIDLDPQADLTKLPAPRPRENDGPGRAGRGTRHRRRVLRGGGQPLPRSWRPASGRARLPGREGALAELLADAALAEVDVVMIDHPPAMSGTSLAGFVASDGVIVVTDVEAFGVANLGPLLEDIEAIAESIRPGLRVLGILANKVDARRSLTAVVLRELRTAFGDAVFRSAIPYDRRPPGSA